MGWCIRYCIVGEIRFQIWCFDSRRHAFTNDAGTFFASSRMRSPGERSHRTKSPDRSSYPIPACCDSNRACNVWMRESFNRTSCSNFEIFSS